MSPEKKTIHVDFVNKKRISPSQPLTNSPPSNIISLDTPDLPTEYQEGFLNKFLEQLEKEDPDTLIIEARKQIKLALNNPIHNQSAIFCLTAAANQGSEEAEELLKEILNPNENQPIY